MRAGQREGRVRKSFARALLTLSSLYLPFFFPNVFPGASRSLRLIAAATISRNVNLASVLAASRASIMLAGALSIAVAEPGFAASSGNWGRAFNF